MKIVSFPFIDVVSTPAGFVVIKATRDHIHEIAFAEPGELSELRTNPGPLTEACKQQLAEYFEGRRTCFELPLQQEGTVFQQHIWELLHTIGYGDRISYLQLARLSGDEKNIRAAASANGRNKLAILVPCHRVVGTNGKLTGYAWGLQRKQLLLDLEAKHSGKTLTLF